MGNGPRCLRFALYLLVVALGYRPAPLSAQTDEWTLQVLDRLLARTPATQTLVRAGDMEIQRAYLERYRDFLVSRHEGSIAPESAFDGIIPTWTSGIVPYAFSNNVSAAHRKVFLDGMAEWATFANLTFTQRVAQANYVTILDDPALAGGQSAVGMIGGQQFLRIGSSAWNRATICHELGHTLGLIHEHQRSDRDSFVTVFTNNILPGTELNFIKFTNSLNQAGYDFLSVMHYARNTFSTNANVDTIVPLPAFLQYINIMGAQFDPVLSAADRAGMAAKYGPPAVAPTNIVTNTKDSGPGSLRAAMYFAFDHPGTTINFNIPTTDPGFSNSVFNIHPTDRLASLVNAMTLDAGTEPTNSNPNGPEILLSGSLIAWPDTFAHGFHFAGSNCAARSFIIIGFPGHGVLIEGTNTAGNTVSGCYIGVGPTGNLAASNGLSGVFIGLGANSNTVGGTTAAARNIISGNADHGIILDGALTRNNVILGNYIGLNAAGTAAITNAYSGILIANGASSNTIGGSVAGARNVISGNSSVGINIDGAGTDAAVIQGNYIGLNATGTGVVSNFYAGIQISSGSRSNLITGNVVSGNNAAGIGIYSSDANVVQGNFIGTDPTGIIGFGNRFSGVDIGPGSRSNLIGGTSVAARNLVSGNASTGVLLAGANTDGNRVQGNYIGTTINGLAPLSNTFFGVQVCCGARSNLIGGTVNGAGNLISGNASVGIVLSDPGTDGTVIQGNRIGVDATGSVALPNHSDGIYISGSQLTTIGGTAPGARNIISGNFFVGINLYGLDTKNNLIQGNYIGVGAAGTNAVGNGGPGIAVSGGARTNTIGGGVGARNIISGNTDHGVVVAGTNTDANVILGNTIGLDVTGNLALGNLFAGIFIIDAARSNLVGGTSAGNANLIAGNGTDGVQMWDTGTTNNAIRGNSIFGNAGLGIALNVGANNTQAPPVLVSAVASNFTRITGSLTSGPSRVFRIEYFASPTGGDEGKTFLGASNVVTTAGGTVNFTTFFNITLPTGQVVTATATDPAGNTSPFSSPVTATMTDSDGDGMPDSWEIANFGSTAQGATGDSDGDGTTNYQEYRAGTSPTSASSALRVTAVERIGVDVRVMFPSAFGFTYRLEFREDLPAGAWNILIDHISGTGSAIQITDPGAATLPRRFYRVSVLP